MAINNIASFHQYTTGPGLPLNNAGIPSPYLDKVGIVWYGNYVQYFNAGIEVPPVVIDPDQRPWLCIRPNASHSTSTTYGQMMVTNTTISPDVAVPGNTIYFGFKFASAAAMGNTGVYLGYRAPSTSTIAASTSLTAIPAAVTGVNQFHWVDFVIKYNANGTTTISIYTDRELVYTAEAPAGQHWALGCGSIARSLVNATNYSQGFYLNDFLTVIDNENDAVKTGPVGPITILALEHKDPVHNSRWTPAPGKTMKDSLRGMLAGTTPRFDDAALIRTDPYGSEMFTSFKAPPADPRRMLAFQQMFVAQKPASMGANFRYQRRYNGVNVGEQLTYQTGTSLDAFQVFYPTVELPENVTAAAAEIEKHGMAFSSVKKTIPL